MEIVVNDTNILIDLYNCGLLSHCNKLNIEFRTLDFVIEEIKEEDQLSAIKDIIKDGTLKVKSLTGEQIYKVAELMGQYNGTCNLSVVDISVMLYAKENDFRLLTGDKTLREKATLENVTVSGILYLIDLFCSQKVINNKDMITTLQTLISSNSRLPHRLIRDRIEKMEKAEELMGKLKKTPNEETLQAMRDAEEGKNLEKVGKAEDLMKLLE